VKELQEAADLYNGVLAIRALDGKDMRAMDMNGFR
jgi:hypothetical protein